MRACDSSFQEGNKPLEPAVTAPDWLTLTIHLHFEFSRQIAGFFTAFEAEETAGTCSYLLKVTDMPGSWRTVVFENWQPQTCLCYVEAPAWGDDTRKNCVRLWNGAGPLCQPVSS